VEEIHGLGGDAFARAVERFQAGEPVTYRGMTLVLHGAGFDVRVPVPVPVEPMAPTRALDLLTRARYRLGALLASAPPLEAVIGNRAPRLVLVATRTPADAAGAAELYELRGDRLRRLV
jgi:hypothetical protein